MEAIYKGIKVNQKYQDAQQYAKKIQGISRTTNWFQTKTKYDGARRLIQEKKNSEKQLEFGRRQLIIRRTTRLQQLYQKQLQQWEDRLRQQGIALYKNKL